MTEELKVGDVIESMYTGRLGVITNIRGIGKYVLFTDGSAGALAHNDIKKTGKHIDINSVLEQLRGG